jgi:hypothetical protein
MITIAIVLGLAALIIAIWSAVKPAPILWVAVILLAIIELLRSVPFK